MFGQKEGKQADGKQGQKQDFSPCIWFALNMSMYYLLKKNKTAVKNYTCIQETEPGPINSMGERPGPESKEALAHRFIFYS